MLVSVCSGCVTRQVEGGGIALSTKSKQWIIGEPFKQYPDNVTFSNFFMYTYVVGRLLLLPGRGCRTCLASSLLTRV